MKKLHGPIAPEERGALLEGWILHLLRAFGEDGGLFDELHYWAPHPQTRLRSTSCSAGAPNWRRSRSIPGPAITPACCRDCERTRSSRDWRDGCSSAAASGLSGPGTNRAGSHCLARWKESKTFQVLTHHAYHLEHDFNHGARGEDEAETRKQTRSWIQETGLPKRELGATLFESLDSVPAADYRAGSFPAYGSWDKGAYSSAGEHFVDIEGVTGSIPVTPTISRACLW